jgi:transporter family-2 protein
MLQDAEDDAGRRDDGGRREGTGTPPEERDTHDDQHGGREGIRLRGARISAAPQIELREREDRRREESVPDPGIDAPKALPHGGVHVHVPTVSGRAPGGVILQDDVSAAFPNLAFPTGRSSVVFGSLHAVSASRLAVVFAFIAGLAGAAQAAIAGALGRRVGSVQAAAFGTTVAALILVALAIALGRGSGILSVVHQPPWMWLIGALGATIVLAITFAPPLIGTFATVALLIAGQLIAGALIDAYGLLGSPRLPVTVTRASGLILVAVGAALTLKH